MVPGAVLIIAVVIEVAHFLFIWVVLLMDLWFWSAWVHY